MQWRVDFRTLLVERLSGGDLGALEHDVPSSGLFSFV